MNRSTLLQQRAHVVRIHDRADQGVRARVITPGERDALLLAYFGTTDKNNTLATIDCQLAALPERTFPWAVTIGVLLVACGLFAVLFHGTASITGAVILDHPINTTYTTDARINIELPHARRINITGTAQGDGTVLIALVTNGDRHLLYGFNNGSVTPHANLTKASYLMSEPVIFNASNVSSAYLMGENAQMLDNTTLADLAPGQYTITLLINDTELSYETLPFTVIEVPVHEDFNACGDLCNTDLSGNATIDIRITGNATLTLSNILIANTENHPPQLVHEIPDIVTNGTAYVDVGGAFTDPDGDTLSFDTSHHDGMTETIDNGILTVTGPPGTRTYTVYASDLQELSPSNTFSITILANQTPPIETNNSDDTTGETLNNTLNATVSAAAAPSCTEPDPNRRPLDCIQGNDSTFFKPEQIFLENKHAIAVGQLTPVGNLLIRGQLIEHSKSAPSSNDYVLGYANADGDFVPTLWIDTNHGDLHLRGTITEANGNIIAADGLSAIANQRGIVLALVDRTTGDLTVRGNLVPYRRNVG